MAGRRDDARMSNSALHGLVPTVAIVGAGPAGLMAAEVLAAGGARVEVFDAMPSPGRKFLLAGVGGMNITHAEARPRFVARYGARRDAVAQWLSVFGPEALREWIHGLGVETFVGSSGRVFPRDMKAAPLLRAWLQRLRAAGVALHVRHRWQGWDSAGALCFATPAGERTLRPDAVVLALGGGSWARLGSDGAWMPWLAARGVETAPLRPANCGFDLAWSEHFRQRYAGEPVKAVAASWEDPAGRSHRQRGEFVVTASGVEGSLIYALSAPLREAIEARGVALLELDLAPDRDLEALTRALAQPAGGRSLAKQLRSRAGIAGVKAGLLREAMPRLPEDAQALARLIKHLPLRLRAPRPLDEAISSAGGVRLEALTPELMLRALPGFFCAGEMLDWEAPTGGYLLSACFASGRVAGAGALQWLGRGP